MYNAIIILGNGCNPDGSLRPPAQARVKVGYDLLVNQQAPRIIMSGKQSIFLEEDQPVSEAAAMKDYALSLGAPPESLLVEKESLDTIGNAYFTKTKFLEPNAWHNVIVVTSHYHLPRSQYIFNKVLGPNYQVDFQASDSQLDEQAKQIKHEHESKKADIIKQWLDPIADGDDQAIWQFLNQLPGYNPQPKYSRQQLLALLTAPNLDTKGLSG